MFPMNNLARKGLISDIFALQCLWNYTGTSAFADVSYLMADVAAIFFCIKMY